MAVYIDLKVEGGPSLKTHICWHKIQTILAVASYDQEKGGTINLYQEDGSPLVSDIYSKPGVPVTSILWHPVRKILAIGWENGDLCVWNDHDQEQRDAETQHKKAVAVMKWSENGTRLVTADAVGTCIGWKVDSRGEISTVFHHELKDYLTDIVFQQYPEENIEHEISKLAKAAVSGDEKALNLFSSWSSPPIKEGKTRNRMSFARKESYDFFVGSVSGTIYYVTENGSCSDVLHCNIAIRQLLYYDQKDILVVVTDNLTQYKVGEEGALTEHARVKLSGRTSEISVAWVDDGLLAMSTGERVLRLLNVDNNDSTVLSMDSQKDFKEHTEVITCISCEKTKQIIAGGTSHGNIVTWKYAGSSRGGETANEDMWKFQAAASVQGAVKSVKWGSMKKLLSVITTTDIYILNQQELCWSLRDQVAAIQVSARELLIELVEKDCHIELKTDIHIKSVIVSWSHVAVSTGKRILFYELDADQKSAKYIGAFDSTSQALTLHEQSAYIIENGKVEVKTFQGTTKQSLIFTEEEGIPVSIDLCGTYLVVGTSSGYVKMWDVNRREPRPHAGPKSLASVLKDNGQISSIKCNSKGDKVSMIVCRATIKGKIFPDPILYVWDLESDSLLYFDFAHGKGEEDDNSPQSAGINTSPTRKAHADMAKRVCGRFPTSHFWDSEDSRFLVCEASLLPLGNPSKNGSSLSQSGLLKNNTHQLMTEIEEKPEILVVSMFVTSEQGLLIQDSFSLNLSQQLMGVSVPYFYLLEESSENNVTDESSSNMTSLGQRYQRADLTQNLSKKKEYSSSIIRQSMRDFVGLEKSDKATKKAIMTFSFFLATGNMDEAFKAIKVIKNESVWENMACMCVKTKRLDVASVCLGKMGHARGAKALREAVVEPELDAQVAILAVHLGMLEEAEHLLKSCRRYDLLSKLYQDSGQWGKALEVAEHNDRVHLRTTYYNYAQHLEAKGDITAAIPLYEKSETHHFEVPRMLFEEPRALEAYILKSKDKELVRWWAQYMESIGEMETALHFYEAAQDYLSLVRVYCYCNNLEKAAEIANETGNRAACFHLGRQFENQDNIKEAVNFFSRARAYNNAIRICKENNFEDHLLNLALMSGSQEMAEVARYYEEKPGQQDKAVMLYHKAGYVTKAVELAFKTKEFNALQSIASDLNSNSDPQLLHQCAQFFMENGQYEKAVDLLAIGRKYLEALDLCVEHNVAITEDLAEKLTMPKEEGDIQLRTRVLEKIGECCMVQENYHLAAKKFTQAGKRAQAMKALLKSGDTEKIVFFAGVSRQKEIYVMAANYLQSLDWRQDPEIMKNIIGFYTKGKALDLLAGFYDACSQVEIDEYQNYEKALGALNEAYKCLTKAQSGGANGPQIEAKLAQMKLRMELVKRFVQARRLYRESPEESLQQCKALLEEEGIELAIRRGDIYGYLVEHLAEKGDYKTAHSLIEEMQVNIPGVNLPYYISVETLKAIYKALDIQPGGSSHLFGGKLKNGRIENGAAEVEESEEEVEEDFQEENGY
ncbi:LOW QUALITY PROTEIN: intraflagellar transport protein 140 homolog [Limulus polyphemus]|uniref:LOW QUALITY PROTEIN: intraflagellar transport protein 140 homolog n=1 Tax=Limulus polyphemus TaxID=6850 RepID=A0ABM1T2V1_LIMPO|nr:LOW QUALITY PROTEIN: intraflagellar transport protein 140 homolog [Limulus polyphemus]